MSSIPPFARAAARAIASERLSSAPSAETRERAAAAIATEIARQRVRRGRTRAAAAAVASMAVAAAAWFMVGAVRRPPTPSASGAGRASADAIARLADGGSLAPGMRLVVAEGDRSSLHLHGGSRLTLSGPAELGMDAPHAGANLVFGFLLAEVGASGATDPVAADERFRLRTADAEIATHGGVFDVRYDPRMSCTGEASTHTRIRVQQGTVTVRSQGVEARLDSGQSWPRECVGLTGTAAPAAAPAAASARSGERGQQGALAGQAAAAAPSKLALAPAPASALGEQNDMLAAALSARRSGDARRAVALLDLFLSKYPNSPLEEAAAIERMKALDSFDPAAARAAAREYLRRHPHGAARTDAERILR